MKSVANLSLDPQPEARPARRAVLAGAGAAGALAAVAAVLPATQGGPAAAVADAKPGLDTGGGYQLTEHVKRYYQTARV